MGQSVLDGASVQEFLADEIIIREGVVRRELYKVTEGTVALYINYGRENEYQIGTILPGQCFGEICLLCSEPSMYTAVAKDRVTLTCITTAEFEEFIHSDGQNAVHIITNLARGLVNLKLDIMMFMEDLTMYNNIEEYKLEKLRHDLYKNMLHVMGAGQNYP